MLVQPGSLLSCRRATRSGALALLGTETQGMAIALTDMSMVIRDTGTPANNFSGNPNSKLTYTAPSTKWILGANGLYTSGTTLRTEYNTSGVAQGLRVEEARTNLVLRSQEMDNAAWTKFAGTSVSANSTTSPDGTSNADRFVEINGGGSFHRLETTSAITVSSGVAYTFSGFLKSSGRRYVHVRLDYGTIGGFCVDLNTGTITSGFYDGSNAAAALTSTSSTALINGWYYVQGTFTTSTTAAFLYFYLSDSPTTTTFTGDGASGAYIWQVQLELGTFSTSPIVTTTASVTRAADDETLASSLFPYSATNGTLYARFRLLSVAAEAIAVQLDDGTANERINIGSTSGAAAQLKVIDGGAAQTAPLTTGAVTTSAFAKLAASWKVNDFAASLDGAAAVTDVVGTLPTMTTLRLGSATGSATMLNGHLQALLYLPRDMSDAELAVRSAS